MINAKLYCPRHFEHIFKAYTGVNAETSLCRAVESI